MFSNYKIAYIVRNAGKDSPHFSLIKSQIEGLALLSSNVSLLCESTDEDQFKNIQIVKTGSSLLSWLKRTDGFSDQVNKWLTKEKVNFVIGHGEAHPHDLLIVNSNSLLKSELIKNSEDNDLVQTADQLRTFIQSHKYRLILTTSQFAKRDLAMRCQVDLQTIDFIYPAYDKDIFQFKERQKKRLELRNQFQIKETDFIVALNANSPFETSGLDLALQVLNLLNFNENIKFAIQKGAVQSDKIRNLAEANGSIARIIELSSKEDEFLFAADAYFSPALYSDYDQMLVHSLACGLPSLCSQTVANSELVQSKQLVKSATDTSGWIEAFEQVVNNKEWTQAISRQSAERMSALNLHLYSQRFAELLRRRLIGG